MSDPCPADLDSSIMDSQVRLDELTRRAEHELQHQPLPTQKHLTSLTRHVFAQYKLHGTAVSLHTAITGYFKPSSEEKDRLRLSPPLPQDYTPPPPDLRDCRMVDEESINLVRDMPFRVDRKLHIRPNVKLPQGLLEGIDRIFRIYQAEAEAMLSHHCEKYGDEAIFRIGIRSLIMSRSDSLFQSTSTNPQGLDAETRLLFLQVYERNPDLNIAERRLLARSARVGTDVIEAFWEHLAHLRRPYMAMRTVIAARELRKQARYHEQVRLEIQRHRQEIENRMRMTETETERRWQEQLERQRRRRGVVGMEGAAGLWLNNSRNERGSEHDD